MDMILRAILAMAMFSVSATCVLADTTDKQQWPQWRGPQRDGRISAATWPEDLSEKRLVESWSVKQGPSYSGPIVTANRVFVTETKDRKFEVVRALDRESGKQIWEAQWEGAMRVPFFAAANGSWIRATPAYDGERLYVAGMRDVLVCLNAETGKQVWKLDFVDKTKSALPSFGFVSSPLILGENVFVQAGGAITKVNKLTGEIVWQAMKDGGGTWGSAFSSPVIATIAGKKQLVVQTRSKLAGVNIDDGKVLWSKAIRAFRGMNILTPMVIEDSIFTSSYGGRSQMLKVTRTDDEWKVAEAWNHKSQGYMSSPVVIDGYIYLHLRNQRMVCLDAKTGDEKWTTKPFGKYWSMVANGNKLLALDQTGELRLIDASPKEYREVSKRRVADDSWAHLAIVGDEIFVRDLAAMKKFVWK